VRAIYLWVNAALYLVFAFWMTLRPWRTSAAVGYVTLSASGRSEFLVIYGGLQLGLSAFFAWCAWRPTLHGVGILLALCLYAPIVLYRLITIGRFWPLAPATIGVAVLEVALLVGAIMLIAWVDLQ